MPKISIIIPVYNVEKYLKQCLDSIINQTLQDTEIICVNDGSTDNSYKILEKYASTDNRIKIVVQENQGLGAARNTGMKYATGDYIGFVDSDDWIDKDFYEILYNRAIEKGADIVRGTYKYEFENHSEVCEIDNLLQKKLKEDDFLNPNDHSVVVWPNIYKTSFLKNNNIMYFDNINCAEDISFTARTSLYSNIIVSACNTYYHYRQNRKGQLSEMSFEKIFAQLKANKITTEFINSRFDYIDEDDYKKAYLRCCWRLDNIYKNSQNIKNFKNKEQEKYLKETTDIVNSFKLDKKIIIAQYPTLSHIVNKNIKAYKKQYSLKKPSKIFSIKNEYKNNIKRKIINILGLKLSFKVSNNKYKEIDLLKIKREILKAKVVSFDIFDTLLLRPFAKPVDIFHYIEQIYNEPGFAEARIQAEIKTRENSNVQEINFDDIYTNIDKKFLYLKEKEIKVEEQLLIPNSQIKLLYDYAQKHNKKIIIISDMYFNEETITKFLTKNGYGNWNKLYLSSSLKKTKKQGDLYDYVKEDLKIKPSGIYHIGDNYDSDYQNARKAKLKAFHYKKPINQLFDKNKIFENFYKKSASSLCASIVLGLLATDVYKKKDYWENFGFTYGGALTLAYAKWLLKQTEKDNIKNIFFIARDGYSLQKVFEKIKCNEDIKSYYVYAPRALAENINDNSKITNYLEYINNFKIATEEKIALVDTVSKNLTSQKFLDNIIKNQIIGYYWFVGEQTELLKKDFPFKTFRKAYNSGLQNWDIMEFILTAPEPPIIGVDGNMPIYMKPTKHEKLRNNLYSQISNGIIDFVEKYLKIFGSLEVPLILEDLNCLLNIFITNPSIREIKNFSKIMHAQDAKHTKYDYLMKKWYKK